MRKEKNINGVREGDETRVSKRATAVVTLKHYKQSKKKRLEENPR